MSRRMLNEPEGYELLNKHGIPVPQHDVAKSEDEAAKIAATLGFPVVMKIVSNEVVHKSDAGAVIVGIDSDKKARSAYHDIQNNVKARVPNARIDGVIVEKMMPPGLELILGGKTDPSFGKVITFGLGGTLVELIKDVSLRALPISKSEIAGMVHDVKAHTLISGYRGGPSKDEAALESYILAVCELFEKTDELVEFDINPLILYEKGGCAVDARLYVDDSAVTKKEDLTERVSSSIFRPESIAVVGASNDSSKVGFALFRNLTDFPGKVYPVNPGKDRIQGQKAFNRLTEIPGKLDMAVIAVPAAVVPTVIEDAGKKGVKIAVVITAGFKEIGDAGESLEQQVLEIARRYRIRMVGPNCLGIILPYMKINATFDPVSPKPGHVAFISQSGATITTVVDWSLQEHRGFSAVISVGNQADMGFDEYLQFVAEDEDTKCVILYVEEIRNGQRFMKSVKELTKKKPVVAIKSGSSERGQKAASSHTGSLAGSYEVYQAVFRQCGVIPARSLREAFQIGELLASEGYPKGNRAIIVSNAGGFAVLASDYSERFGLKVIDLSKGLLAELNSFLTEEWSHENPMDLVGDATADRYSKVFDLMISHESDWDVAFVVSVPTTTLEPRHLAKDIVRFSKSTEKMIVGCLLGGDSIQGGVHILRDANLPNFQELEEAFRSVGEALRRKEPEG
jgi:acetyl coenzyme A synthetase (ADP forming)-like protein